jgi:single-strand DNA-binding protein
MNTIILIGRLTRDPELRYTQQGTPVASFTLAVDRPFTNAQGQKDADFIDCVAWRKLGETVGNHLSKGRLVAVEGRLQIRSYEAQDGTKRRAAEVVADSVQFLDSRKTPAGDIPATVPAGASVTSEAADDGFPDDLPF